MAQKKSRRNTANVLKSANTYLITKALQLNGTMAIEDLIRSTGLSRPTAQTIIESLKEEKIVQSAGRASSQGGRQPMLYELDAQTHFSIGIDFEYLPIHLSVANLRGEEVYNASWDSGEDEPIDAVVGQILTHIEEALRALAISEENIIGIAVGIPGTISVQENLPLMVTRFKALNRYPLAERIRNRFDVPVHLRNDTYLMSYKMIAEPPFTSGRKVIYIAFRTGISAAVFDGDTHQLGENGNFGYIGHTIVDPSGVRCDCGQTGCLETVASKKGVLRQYRAHRETPAVRFDEVLRNAEMGDPLSLDLVLRAAHYLAISLSNLIKTLDIHTVVIDDLNCSMNHPMAVALRREIDELCSSFLERPFELYLNYPPKHAPGFGAAIYELELFFQKPKLHLTVTEQ